MQADLTEAFELLLEAPERSETLARAVLARGDDPGARLLLSAARRLQGDHLTAAMESGKVAVAHPNWAGAQFEVALALNGQRNYRGAQERLAIVERLGGVPGLWRAAGDAHWALGDKARADQAYMRHVDSHAVEQGVHRAGLAAQRGDRAGAERALRLQLSRYPHDPLALRLLAEHCSADGRFKEAAALLRQCVERAPSFVLARYGLALVLFHAHQLGPAMAELDVLLARESQRLEFLRLSAEALARAGDFEASVKRLEQMLALYPDDVGGWVSYGDALRTLGRRAECEAVYRRAIVVRPSAGEAYWGLANLKTFAFADDDIAAMRAHVASGAAAEQTAPMLFALGRALEDRGAYAESFDTYARANAEARKGQPYDRAALTEHVRRAREVFTAQFFAEGGGATASDPIFVLGMPRAGSTLVEQILASHSAVEGTMELQELLAIAKRVENEGGDYPLSLRERAPDFFTAIGDEYVARTRPFRRTDAPRFIDKMPDNFREAGLILRALPSASIIDVRRHPLACGVSIFKQYWAMGPAFAYGLEDIGHAYRAYVELMAHLDAAAPGRIHRVTYEDLVANPEREVRALLNACGLPFEEACLRFYENKRAVRTPSSEQVRQPVFTSGLDNWRPFEPWLEPLKHELGDVLTYYPAIPPGLA